MDKAIVLYPTNRKFFALRATSYAELNQHKRAIEDYTRSINLGNQYSYSYALRGASYYHLNQYEDAIKDYTKAINLAPNEAIFYIGRAKAYDELKQYEKKELDFTKALDLLAQDNTEKESTKSEEQGNDEIYYLSLALDSIDKKQYIQAIELLDKAISLNPQNPESYYWRGVAYTQKC